MRRLIIDANNNDINLNVICATFQVEKHTVVRILKKFTATGETDKSPQGGIKPNK
jgi:hypothetical protein